MRFIGDYNYTILGERFGEYAGKGFNADDREFQGKIDRLRGISAKNNSTLALSGPSANHSNIAKLIGRVKTTTNYILTASYEDTLWP